MRVHRSVRRDPAQERRLQLIQNAAIAVMALGVLILVYLAVATTR